MQEITNDSSQKIINETTILKDTKKSQTYIGNTKNLFKILNSEKKNHKKKKNYYFKKKLNILENLKEKICDDKIDTFTSCELKINDKYQQGYLRIDKDSLIILRNKTDEQQNNYISDRGVLDCKKYNSNTRSTDITSNLSLNFNKNKNIKDNILLYLDFNLITCKFLINKKKQKFRLLILGKKLQKEIFQYNIVKFKMLNLEKEIFNNICKNINNLILSSNGYKEHIINGSLNIYFYNNYTISCHEFTKFAKTCDLILFRGYSYCSKCQRCFTQGHYDHIGLLVKISNELFVYETTGKDGVVLRKWFEFIYYYWYLLYDKISFRKLIVSPDAMKKFIINNNEIESNLGKKCSNFSSGFSDSNLDIYNKNEINNQFYNSLGKKVDAFIQKIEGKKYYFSVWHYLFKGFYKSKITNNFKNNGYFCSELIAAIYNYCGIISNRMNITNYLPSSFAENGDAVFNEGFSLGPEYIIIFS